MAGRRGRNYAAAARGLALEHQVGDVDRGGGGEALSGRLEPAHDALEDRVPVSAHDFVPLGSPAPERAPHAGTRLACSMSSSTVHWSYASRPYLTAASRPSGAIKKSAGRPKWPAVGFI